MSIRPVVTNGMIQRTQDVGIIKQQEDDKPVVQQHHLSIRQEKQEDGSLVAGISARKFTDDVLQYLFDHIALEDDNL